MRIEETIKKIEKGMQGVDSQKREVLLQLVKELKEEIQQLPASSQEQGESIARFTGVSADELNRNEPNQNLVDLALQGLATSAQDLESTHPKVVHLVNSICDALTQIGV